MILLGIQKEDDLVERIERLASVVEVYGLGNTLNALAAVCADNSKDEEVDTRIEAQANAADILDGLTKQMYGVGL